MSIGAVYFSFLFRPFSCSRFTLFINLCCYSLIGRFFVQSVCLLFRRSYAVFVWLSLSTNLVAWLFLLRQLNGTINKLSCYSLLWGGCWWIDFFFFFVIPSNSVLILVVFFLSVRLFLVFLSDDGKTKKIFAHFFLFLYEFKTKWNNCRCTYPP